MNVGEEALEHKQFTRTPKKSPGRTLMLVALLAAVASLLSACLTAEQSLGVELVNNSRVARHQTKVAASQQLTDKAQGWADYLAARNGNLIHSDLGSNLGGFPACAVSENLAQNNASSEEDGVRVGHMQFLASPGHKANMLAPGITHAGVGVATSSTGARYVVQVFARKC